MKVLIVGGAAQGKLDYARRAYHLEEGTVLSGDAVFPDIQSGFLALSGLHLAIQRLLDRGDDPALWLEGNVLCREDWIVLCDEVGCGVVPIERSRRQWREAVGRACCVLAEQAETVIRVSFGCPLLLKGRLP